MKKRIFFTLLTTAYVTLCGHAQSDHAPSVGMTVPDIKFSIYENGVETKSSIHEFKGRLLILDFWATWCAPCIRAFPRMDSLQQLVGSEVKILPVTYENTALVESFLDKMQKNGYQRPVTVENDSLLKNFFKPGDFPHYVWINEESKIVAITEAKEVTQANVEKVLKVGIAHLPVKNDYSPYHISYVENGAFAPALERQYQDSVVLKRLDPQDLIVRSVFTHWVEGLVPGIRTKYEDSSIITARNMDIGALYICAFGIPPTIKPVVEVGDPDLYRHITGRNPDGTRFFQPGNEALQWMRKNCYSYEVEVCQAMRPQWRSIMLEDLNRYFGAKFGIKGELQKRTVKSISLIKTRDVPGIASAGGTFDVKTDRFSLKITNGTIGTLRQALFLPLQNYPSIQDETGYDGKIDIELNCNLSNFAEVNTQLERYGLKLIQKEIMGDVVVIKDL